MNFSEVVESILNASLSREALVVEIEDALTRLKKSLEEAAVPLEQFAILKVTLKDLYFMSLTINTLLGCVV